MLQQIRYRQATCKVQRQVKHNGRATVYMLSVTSVLVVLMDLQSLNKPLLLVVHYVKNDVNRRHVLLHLRGAHRHRYRQGQVRLTCKEQNDSRSR